MKNKLTHILVLIFAITAFDLSVSAQEDSRLLNNGVTVAVITKTIPPVSNIKTENLFPMLMTNVEETQVWRTILDKKNRLKYEYNIEIEAEYGSDNFKVRFKAGNLLSTLTERLERGIKSLKETQTQENQKSSQQAIIGFGELASDYKTYKNTSLPKYPDELSVKDGDTIVLDILEDPQTGTKVQDFIRITREVKQNGYFWDLAETRAFSLNDVQFNLSEYQIFAGRTLINPPDPDNPRVPDDPGVSYRGGFAIFYTPKGKYLLSPTPNERYGLVKTGVIENDKIILSESGVTYQIVSKVPILGKPGKWILWGKFKPRPKDAKVNNNSPRIFAGDDLDEAWFKY
jgi:hypothetical protein